MKEIRIDLNLELNLHGDANVNDLMWNHHEKEVRDLIVEKMSRQLQAAMREELAKQLGAETATPADLAEIRDLMEQALRDDFMTYRGRVGEALGKLRRLTA